jgi:hypothetical protein
MQRRIDVLEDQYRAFAARIDAPKQLVQFHEVPTNLGAAHVELAGSHLYYVVTERGIEFERRHTEDPDKLLYWLISDLTFQMACDYELKHRKEGEDFRRQLFTKQLELLGHLKKERRTEREADLRLIVAENPFRDETRG